MASKRSGDSLESPKGKQPRTINSSASRKSVAGYVHSTAELLGSIHQDIIQRLRTNLDLLPVLEKVGLAIAEHGKLSAALLSQSENELAGNGDRFQASSETIENEQLMSSTDAGMDTRQPENGSSSMLPKVVAVDIEQRVSSTNAGMVTKQPGNGLSSANPEVVAADQERSNPPEDVPSKTPEKPLEQDPSRAEGYLWKEIVEPEKIRDAAIFNAPTRLRLADRDASRIRAWVKADLGDRPSIIGTQGDGICGLHALVASFNAQLAVKPGVPRMQLEQLQDIVQGKAWADRMKSTYCDNPLETLKQFQKRRQSNFDCGQLAGILQLWVAQAKLPFEVILGAVLPGDKVPLMSDASIEADSCQRVWVFNSDRSSVPDSIGARNHFEGLRPQFGIGNGPADPMPHVVKTGRAPTVVLSSEHSSDDTSDTDEAEPSIRAPSWSPLTEPVQIDDVHQLPGSDGYEAIEPQSQTLVQSLLDTDLADDAIKHEFDVIVSLWRHSGPVSDAQVSDAVEFMCGNFEGFCATSDSYPGQRTKYSRIDLTRDLEVIMPCVFRHVFTSSSQLDLFSDNATAELQREMAPIYRFLALLKDGTRVLWLGAGLDGVSTNVDTFRSMVRLWPALDHFLDVCTEEPASEIVWTEMQDYSLSHNVGFRWYLEYPNHFWIKELSDSGFVQRGGVSRALYHISQLLGDVQPGPDEVHEQRFASLSMIWERINAAKDALPVGSEEDTQESDFYRALCQRQATAASTWKWKDLFPKRCEDCNTTEIEIEIEDLWRRGRRNWSVLCPNCVEAHPIALTNESDLIVDELIQLAHWRLARDAINYGRPVRDRFVEFTTEMILIPPRDLKVKFHCDSPGCDASYASRSRLTLHMNNKHGDEADRFYCDYLGCDASYTNLGSLYVHMKEEHPEGRFHCDRSGCDASYKHKCDLSQHIRDKHELGGRGYDCDRSECDASYQFKCDLSRHIREKHELGGRGYDCNRSGCDASYTTSGRLKVHIKEQHPEGRFYCDRSGCDASYGSKAGLLGHISKQHQGGRWLCDRPGCDASFSSKPLLKVHISKEHPKPKPLLKVHTSKEHPKPEMFRCDRTGCDKSYAKNKELQQHIRRRHEGRRFRCDRSGCNAAYVTTDGLKEHIKAKHEGAIFPCPHSGCEVSCERESGLKKHIKSVHEAIRYNCDRPGCKVTYTTSSGLKEHIEVVHEGKRYNCDRPGCKASYTAKASLTEHIKAKHEGAIFRCPHSGCSASREREKALRDHIRRMH